MNTNKVIIEVPHSDLIFSVDKEEFEKIKKEREHKGEISNGRDCSKDLQDK